MNLTKIQFKLNDIGKYRQEIFGIAIISVIIFHYFEGLYKAYGVGLIRSFAGLILGTIGSVGVDIFIFLSGYGIYYSLKKNQSRVAFFSRRLKRVIIPYLIFGLFFWAIKDFYISHVSIGRFLYDYSLLSFWGEGLRTFWYISFIFILYLISPMVYSKGPNGIQIASILSVMLCICLFIISPQVFNNTEIALCRGPIYFIGMYVAYLSEKKNKSFFDARKMLLLLSLSIPVKIISTLSGFALRRLFNGFYGLFLIAVYIFFRKATGNHESKLTRILILAGEYSLELYITHVAIRSLMGTLHYPSYDPFNYVLLILLSIVLSAVLFLLQKI